MEFEKWWMLYVKSFPVYHFNEVAKEIAMAAWMGAVDHIFDESKGAEPYYTGSNACCAHLISYGNNKIAAIKTVRTYTGLALKESKDLVESVPCTLRGYTGAKLRSLVEEWNGNGGKAEFHEANCNICAERFRCYTER